MNQLKMKNPQMYQMLSQGKINPMSLLKQMANNYPEQMGALFNQAQSIGFPSEVLTEIQNQIGINAQ